MTIPKWKGSEFEKDTTEFIKMMMIRRDHYNAQTKIIANSRGAVDKVRLPTQLKVAKAELVEVMKEWRKISRGQKDPVSAYLKLLDAQEKKELAELKKDYEKFVKEVMTESKENENAAMSTAPLNQFAHFEEGLKRFIEIAEKTLR